MVIAKTDYRNDKKYINEPFLQWLRDNITKDFETYFIGDGPLPNVGVPLELQYELNSADDFSEASSDIYVNIGSCVLEPAIKYVC